MPHRIGVTCGDFRCLGQKGLLLPSVNSSAVRSRSYIRPKGNLAFCMI
jgi:hypothetical protein